ncbi:MAG: stage III sporulation protein AB [Oscillospiraceae bacterium]|nr:stage III sporulation protein AB [Oscillospiraceae bacterium]
MLKTLALSLLFLACGGTGAMLSRAMQLRVRELERALQMLASLRAQLQYSRPPLPQMLGAVCEQSQHPAFLPHCLASMREGTAFPGAWRDAIESHCPGLRAQDRGHLLALGELLGASDAEGQREALLVQESLLETLLVQARAQRDTRGRAAFTLGILAGLTVMILLM